MTRNETLTLLDNLYTAVKPSLPEDESGQSINDLFEQTLSALKADQEYIFLAEELLTRMITFYPHLTPVIPRELLWSIGGSCLGFMEDSEIDEFAARNDDEGVQH